MKLSSENLIYFVECRKATKRFSSARPNNLDELRESISEKFDLKDTNFTLQIKDADFQIMCEVEDIDQLYGGGKVVVNVQEPPQTESAKAVDDEMVLDLQNQLAELQKQNLGLQRQVDAYQPVEQRGIPEGFHVWIKGLPYSTTPKHISDFFRDFAIVDSGIWMLQEYGNKKPRGEALVTFATEADQQGALAKDRDEIEGRWIEVKEAKERLFNRYQKIMEGSQLLAVQNLQTRYLAKLRGFEWTHTEEDVEKFLDPVKPVKIWVIFTKQGSNGGVVYVELADEKALQQTLAKKKQILGERYIDVWEANEDEFKFELAQMCGSEVKSDKYNAGCRNLRMDGIPRDANDQDIAKFFRRVGVLPIRIHRKNTGENAYVEFLTAEQCKIALTKNHHHIGDRYITLKAAPSSEISERVPQHAAPLGFDERSHQSHSSHSSYRPERQQQSWGKSRERYDPYGRRETDAAVQPNATVKLSGLPYTATKEDIIRFFGNGLSYMPESIKVLMKNGKSTGTGRITFESVEEAQRAIAEKQNQYIGTRFIHLSYWKMFH